MAHPVLQLLTNYLTNLPIITVGDIKSEIAKMDERAKMLTLAEIAWNSPKGPNSLNGHNAKITLKD